MRRRSFNGKQRSIALASIFQVCIESAGTGKASTAALHVCSTSPRELYAGCATIEYQMPAGNVLPPAYVFIIDTSVAEDELRACVASLTQALTTLQSTLRYCACFLTMDDELCPWFLGHRHKLKHPDHTQ